MEADNYSYDADDDKPSLPVSVVVAVAVVAVAVVAVAVVAVAALPARP